VNNPGTPARRRVRAGLAGLTLAASFTLFTLGVPFARAETSSPEELFKQGAAALERGEYAAAIDLFESLADRGFKHPDASYDMGLAYIMRAKAGADRPGDLGRAAAAFEETLLLRPDDRDADVALDLVRAEVTRRRARKSKDAIDVRPTLDRMLVGLASEQTWGLCAIAASLLLAAGFVLYRRPADKGGASNAMHVAGSVLVPVALVALALFIPLAWGARVLRLETRPGVVIVNEARLSDENGRALGAEPVPEAARIETSDRRGGLVHIRWGATEGWLPIGSVRLIGP